MKAYVGQTRSRELVATLARFGIGECTTRGELPARRSPWFYDNGAYSDHVAGRPFDLVQFTRDMRAIEHGGKGARAICRPDFLVLPDLVARGLESLELSIAWARGEWFPLPRFVPLYLAVQDGMTPAAVEPWTVHVGGLFVGGSLAWKLKTAPAWVELGRSLGLPVHIGRVGTVERVRWARDIGADSIDSALPLWADDKLAAWLREVFAPACRQPSLFA